MVRRHPAPAAVDTDAAPHLGVGVVQGVVDDLVVPDPDLPVVDRERHAPIKKGLGLGVAPRHAEGHGQEVLDGAPVRLGVERRVEAQ